MKAIIFKSQNFFEYFKILKNNMWILYMMNSYLLYAIYNLLILPSDSLYFRLQPKLSIVNTLLIFVLSLVGQFIVSKDFKQSVFQRFFIVLSSTYLFLGIFKSPSLLVVFGFFIVALALFTKFYFEREKWRLLIPLSLSFTFPKVLSSIFKSNTEDLGKFVIDYKDWNYNQFWMILTVLLYGLVLLILFNSLFNHFRRRLNRKLLIKSTYVIVLGFSLVYIFYLVIITIYKVKTLSVSTFDIGIFTQMFESMRRDLTPMTTLERDKLLSHFAVHVSPIFYTILPIYYFLPYLETLETLQILIVFSGLLPLYLILKKVDLPAFIRPLILLWFVVTPAMTTAGSYRMHENFFLVPLLLWLIYAHLAGWKKRLLFITLLTLMVKEDAFIYVVSVGLYFLFQNRVAYISRRKFLILISQIVFPILYFGACLFYLTRFGDGAMVTRFDNFLLAEQKGLVAVVRNIFLNTTYTYASFFTQRKLKYIFLLFVTQAFLPIMQKRWENYLLFIPLIVINLLSDYPYQVDFGFQYSYGTNILILFTSILALESWKVFFKERTEGNNLLLSLITVAIMISTGVLYSSTHSWDGDMKIYFGNKEMYQAIHQTLAKVNREQRILAFSAYTIDLRKTKELYDIFYHNQQEVDQTIDLVLIPRSTFEGTSTEAEIVKKYLESGYTISERSTKNVVFIERKE